MQAQYYCYGCSVNTTDFSVVKVHVDELSSARIWQHKLCATLSASVNINYRLPIKIYYRICTVRHIRIEIIQSVFWVLTWVGRILVIFIRQPMLQRRNKTTYQFSGIWFDLIKPLTNDLIRREDHANHYITNTVKWYQTGVNNDLIHREDHANHYIMNAVKWYQTGVNINMSQKSQFIPHFSMTIRNGCHWA
jgi:hypothetical protein